MKTAVEWLVEQFTYKTTKGIYTTDGVDNVTAIVEQAKEMEKAEKEKFDNMLSMLEEAYRRLENTNMVSLRKEIKETINETFKLD